MRAAFVYGRTDTLTVVRERRNKGGNRNWNMAMSHISTSSLFAVLWPRISWRGARMGCE